MMIAYSSRKSKYISNSCHVFIVTGMRPLKNLTVEGVRSLLTNLNMIISQHEMSGYPINFNGALLRRCIFVEDFRGLLPMPRLKADVMFSYVDGFRAQGVPLHLLVPTGT